MARQLTDFDQPGLGPWAYTLLHEPQLTSELSRLSFATSIGQTHCVSFQPCPNPEEFSQDRYVVENLHLPNGAWKLRVIMDGHAGEETAEHVAQVLPAKLSDLLGTAIRGQKEELSSEQVSSILVDAISSIDNAIAENFLRLFPEPEILTQLSDDEIKAIINDHDTGGQAIARVLLCMRGTTVLACLTNPTSSHLWVASLGDCQAVLGCKSSTGQWNVSILSSNHSAADPEEVQRIESEHPGEEECILKHRVLGAIAVTRAVGDHEFKLPRIYTDRVFLNAQPGFRMHSVVSEFIKRNLTPPYISNRADVKHVELGPNSASQAYLVLCSDGLMDLYDGPADRHIRPAEFNLQAMAKTWIEVVSSASGNMSLALLRHALGGSDLEKVSRMITVEMTERWMDDTTILTERL